MHEVDALGGEIGRLADRCYLQKRVLNRSKARPLADLSQAALADTALFTEFLVWRIEGVDTSGKHQFVKESANLATALDSTYAGSCPGRSSRCCMKIISI